MFTQMLVDKLYLQGSCLQYPPRLRRLFFIRLGSRMARSGPGCVLMGGNLEVLRREIIFSYCIPEVGCHVPDLENHWK